MHDQCSLRFDWRDGSGDEVFVGSGVSIIPFKKIGAGASLGAGSVVIRDIPESVSVFGNPARII